MSKRNRVSLGDLQAAYKGGDAARVRSLLGAPGGGPPERVRGNDRPVPPEEACHVQPSAVQLVLPVLGKPADWPYRMRPEDVDRLAYEAARDVLPNSDREVLRLAAGLSSEAAPSDPRYSVVASVFMRCRQDVLRDMGCADGRIRNRKVPKRGARPRVEGPCSEVVFRDVRGRYWSEDGEEISEAEAWARMSLAE